METGNKVAESYIKIIWVRQFIMYFVPTLNLKCKKNKNQKNLNLFPCFVPHSLLVMPVRETNSILLPSFSLSLLWRFPAMESFVSPNVR